MKTATVPNSEELTALMEVTAELSVALEVYENHFRQSYTQQMHEAVSSALKGIHEHCPDLTDNHLRHIELGLSNAVYENSLNQATLIKCHESTLGIVGAGAPSEIALSATAQYAQQTAVYWEQVNG